MLVDVLQDQFVQDVKAAILATCDSSKFRQVVTMHARGVTDFVTEMNVAIYSELKRRLRLIEDMPVVHDEYELTDDMTKYWVIDPLDGNFNMMHGYPSYCSTVARVDNGVTTHGFVLNHLTHEMFLGIKGGCAYSLMPDQDNRQRLINVSITSRMENALVAYGHPFDKTRLDNLYRICKAIMLQAQDLKCNGPSSLDICYVACGYFDAYFEYDLNEWHYKAAKLILEEAGGTCSNFAGTEDIHGVQNIIATNSILHKEMLEYVKSENMTDKEINTAANKRNFQRRMRDMFSRGNA